jgi:hypothetical protein
MTAPWRDLRKSFQLIFRGDRDRINAKKFVVKIAGDDELDRAISEPSRIGVDPLRSGSTSDWIDL